MSKSSAMLLSFSLFLTGLSSASLLQVYQAAYSQTDYGANTLVDAPINNGWKVSINIESNIGEDAFLIVHVICGALGEIPVEICDDGIDNDGDGLIDIADPDCALKKEAVQQEK